MEKGTKLSASYFVCCGKVALRHTGSAAEVSAAEVLVAAELTAWAVGSTGRAPRRRAVSSWGGAPVEFNLEFCFGRFLCVKDPEPPLSESSPSGRAGTGMKTGSRETRAPSTGLPEGEPGPGGAAGLRENPPSGGDSSICSPSRDWGEVGRIPVEPLNCPH